MANLQKSFLQIGLRVAVFDKFKNYYVPHDRSRYSDGSYFLRVLTASLATASLSTAITYPLDTIHTRLTCDMTPQNQTRYYTSTFQCFNRTNIDEGFRAGHFKGVEAAVASTFLRVVLSFPLLEILRNRQP
jgi:hypothetical protein